MVSMPHLSKEFEKVVFHIFTGKGQEMVFTFYGEHWRKMRRIMIVPFFTNKVVQQYQAGWEPGGSGGRDRAAKAAATDDVIHIDFHVLGWPGLVFLSLLALDIASHGFQMYRWRSPAEAHYIKQRQLLSFTEDDTDDCMSGDNLRIVDDVGQD
ncbi:hypothetical protein RHSIM_Rhsim01G0166100 [Rhododendron simsii]|uniref:Uncharacterized protein n=1 Tax=Rhododendron simsii TaxID=118357 RepID=A0A834HFU8_RHOSS|nr:hypothetical protein RHSIM_Rhsim01G0166100 [Rhododendron simsii]